MDVIFYYNASDGRVINKNIMDEQLFQGEFCGYVDVMNPVARFENEEVLRYNYAYIPAFQRYYDIVNRTAYRDGAWEVTFAVDVLMSFRRDIMNLNVIADKQSMPNNGNEYIDDSSLVAENVMFQTVYNFQNGFNDSGEYILITAG